MRVHYFEDNSGGTTEATVEIYMSGELTETYARTLSENEVWEVAMVTLPEGSVTEESVDNYDSSYRACR